MSETSPEGKMKKGRGLTFAEKQLKKHGWKKGKGLGKQENGISEAIKVKVKSDTAGVGHHSAEQFTFHWWDHLFNTSAANLAVEAGKDGGVRVKKVSKQEGRVTNKKPRRAHDNKAMLYGRFVKAATLKSGGEEPMKPDPSSDSSSDDEKLDLSTARRLTDEELVQACGGRTAHKGARHGLTMSAKLARLEEQEKAFLAAHPQGPKSKPAEGGSGRSSSGVSSLPQEQKVAKRRPVDPMSNKALGEEEGALGDPGEKRKKKKKKKRKQQEEEGGSEAEATGQGEEGRWTEGASRSRRAKQKKK